ncbi:glycosyltransferase family 4 protein [Pseudomonas indica]|uniref:Alpha-1,3-rhamnosyl/mannosyltransferase n=1 Tax=Pseudomonas indica TaxID=137658 RepID=A0A1G9FV14_9PSED|nr:glycosyltransferase family 1 protein [Pseudomonas indica]SDK91993.1 alpha-1,3-rhamnosyl/mannosyltransferase [Pseudomonas indica]
MRIALNARILQAPRTGIGQYVVELVQALRGQDDIELRLFDGWRWGECLPEACLPGYGRWSGLIKRCVPGAYALRRWVEQGRFERGVTKRSVDLYHEPSLWPLAFEGPMVMTLHDLTHVRYPETQPRDRLAEIERHVPRAVERARRILVDSQFVADELVDHYGLARKHLVVAPLGYSARFHPRETEDLREALRPFGVLPGRYLLCVGTLEPRKNLSLVLRAHRRLPVSIRAHYPLLIAGMAGWKSEGFAEELAKGMADGGVRLLGYQSDESLAELVAGARMLLFPSLYEGFGLPVLEAMASGTPVILTDRSALPEVAGSAGTYIDADDENVCAEAIRCLIEDEAVWQGKRAAGLRRAGEFSWRRCAEITVDAYRQALVG